jgi:hypothetical protein
MLNPKTTSRLILLAGDAAVCAAVTVAGFASHAELNAVSRMATTFFPLLAAWLIVSPWFGLYNPDETRRPVMLLKTALAAVIAAPMAAFLRGLWLNAPILPIFILVIAAVGAAGLCIWRALWIVIRRREPAYG